jgi:hypothetical protein
VEIMSNRWLLVLFVAACSSEVSDAEQALNGGPTPRPFPVEDCTTWTQVGGTARHAAKQCGELQGMQVAAQFQVDTNPAQLNADLGFLSEHEGHAVVSGDWVYVPIKAGYVDLFTPSTQRYGVLAAQWVPSVQAPNRQLIARWKVIDVGKWSPIDVIGETDDPDTTNPYAYTNAYMQMFQPIIVGNSLYMPASTGGIVRLNRLTGALMATISPFAGGLFDDPVFTHGTNVLTATSQGTIYYTVTAFPTDANISSRPRGSWLVEVKADNSFRMIDWDRIAAPPFAKAEDGLCAYQFGTAGTPLPTGPDSQAPLFKCGRQRPVFNAAIALTSSGLLLMGTAPNNAVTEGKILAVDPTTLSTVWSADMLGELRYGCGVRLPIGTNPNGRCFILTAGGTTNIGADPRFNGDIRMSGYGSIMDTQIVIAPDGSFTYGGYDSGFTFGGGFDARSALKRFNGHGAFLSKNESFGWEVSPAVQVAKGGVEFTFAQDDQHYSDFDLAVARFSPSFAAEVRGTIPLDFELPAIDFLNAQVAVDNNSNIYGLSAQGLYCKFNAVGTAVDCLELLDADGARYSIETLSQYSVHVGTDIYIIHGGFLYVIESTGGPNKPLVSSFATSARLAAGREAKVSRAADFAHPLPPQ